MISSDPKPSLLSYSGFGTDVGLAWITRVDPHRILICDAYDNPGTSVTNAIEDVVPEAVLALGGSPDTTVLQLLDDSDGGWSVYKVSLPEDEPRWDSIELDPEVKLAAVVLNLYRSGKDIPAEFPAVTFGLALQAIGGGGTFDERDNSEMAAALDGLVDRFISCSAFADVLVESFERDPTPSIPERSRQDTALFVMCVSGMSAIECAARAVEIMKKYEIDLAELRARPVLRNSERTRDVDLANLAEFLVSHGNPRRDIVYHMNTGIQTIEVLGHALDPEWFRDLRLHVADEIDRLLRG